jgi:hypothetical protein
MEELPMTVELKSRVNLGVVLTGWLAHDNNLFDLTCTACGGMYSSFKVRACPKCNCDLTYIRISATQKAMCISEGTMYPALSKNQLAKDAQAIVARKRAVPITYRFKLFEFSNDQGVLPVPAIHKRLKKGALVEVRCFNHQPVITPFESKEGPKVEVMLMVYSAYGDKCEVLSDAKVRDAVTPVRVNKDGSPAPMGPVNDPMARLLAVQQEMNGLIAQLTTTQPGMQTPPPATQTATKAATAAVTVGPSIEEVLMDDECPFDPSEMDDPGIMDDGAAIDPFKVG